MASDDESDQSPAGLVPALRWLPRYERRWLRGDLTAGVAVTALVVPKNLGYAGIAGVPLQNGLYAAAAGRDHLRAVLHVAADLHRAQLVACGGRRRGGARHRARRGGQAAQLVAAITLATGLLFLVLAVFRMGWIARFLSKAVVTGFLAGAAVDVVIGELPKLTGTSSEGDNAWRELGTWISVAGRRALDDGARRASPRWP